MSLDVGGLVVHCGFEKGAGLVEIFRARMQQCETVVGVGIVWVEGRGLFKMVDGVVGSAMT